MPWSTAWTAFVNGTRPNPSTDGEAFVGVEKIADNKVRMKFDKPVRVELHRHRPEERELPRCPVAHAGGQGEPGHRPGRRGSVQVQELRHGQGRARAQRRVLRQEGQPARGRRVHRRGDRAAGCAAPSRRKPSDLIWSFPPDAVQTLESAPGLEVYSAPSSRQYQLSLCPTQGLFVEPEGPPGAAVRASTVSRSARRRSAAPALPARSSSRTRRRTTTRSWPRRSSTT